MRSDGYDVKWNLPKIDFNKEYEKLKDFWILQDIFYIFGKSKATEWVLSFLYKYTKLDKNKLELFLDSSLLNVIDEFLLPIIHSKTLDTTSYILEDGTIPEEPDNFDYNQRRDYLFLLLKCKYNTEQANSILDYHSPLEFPNNNWKEIANNMEYNKFGKVESTFNFINEVI